MSPAPTSSVENVAQVLQPTSTVPLNEKISTLQTFSTTLTDPISMETSGHILSVVPLGLFYNGFSVEDDTLTTVLCDIINRILTPFSYSDIISDENKPFLLQGLTHFTPEIRYLSIQQVFKCLSSDDFITNMVESDIFPLIVASVAFQDIGTANKAASLLEKIALTKPGQDAFFGATCSTMLRQLLQVNGTIRFRVYSLIIAVAGSSDQAFDQCEESGLLYEFTKEMQSDDLLLKMNAIELLNEVAATPSGLVFMEKANLLEDLSNILSDEGEQDIAVVLVKCTILKFFGTLGQNQDVQFEPINSKYHILEVVKKCLESANEEILIASITSLGLIGSHPSGLFLVSQNPALDRFIQIFESAVGSTKTVSIQSLSKLIQVREENNNDIETITVNIYNKINGRPSTLLALIKEAKQPDDDIRYASFALMQSIASHSWGVELMAQSSEFMNYVLDRTTEDTEHGQTWKYAIVQLLVSSRDASRVLGSYYPQCQVYVRQGAHFVPMIARAAVESN